MIDARLVKRFASAPDSEAFELNIHLQAGPGITVLFGPSGAGKTLTLNCLAGFTQPDEGRILVNDELYFDAATRVHLTPQRRRSGYIFQDHALFPHMTVRENLRFAASCAPTEKNRGLNRYRRINELLETFELTELAARKAGQLSGGQKQRAALARILVSEPRLLLLDEPARGLDARLRRTFYDLLKTTRERLPSPILLVTHDLEECFELADSVCLLDRGRLLQSGARDSVFARPVNLDVARSLGVYNVIPASISALDPSRDTSRLSVLNADIETSYLPGHLIGDQGFLCVRQSEMKILSPNTRPDQSQLHLRVLGQSPCSLGVRIAFEHDLFAVVSEAEFEQLRGSDRLRLGIPPSAVYFIGK
ncbi:MAG: ABC transporter ATP-binding protein [Bryobacteraceae bacterium]